MRLPNCLYPGINFSVSIHAPWEGCDALKSAPASMRSPFQFTHPGKGATIGAAWLCSSLCCFNSRTLGRVRPPPPSGSTSSSKFQFTHPGKGATSYLKTIAEHIQFQFTHPGKGATRSITIIITSIMFQFTHPGKGATAISSRKTST